MQVEEPDTLARRNDGTLRNLVENLKTAANPDRGWPALTPSNFRDTLRGTWEDRYRRACERYPEARFLYWAARALRQYDFPLHDYALLPLARDLMDRASVWPKRVRLPRALRYLERYEGIANPRDGQLEAAGVPPADEKTITDSLIRIGVRHHLADALDTLASELIWPGDAPSPVHHPDAVRILRQVITWLPEQPRVWNRLGVALRLAGQPEEAIAAYQKAIELDPKDAFAHGGLADLYVTLGRLKEARCEFEERIRLRPHNTFWPLVALGVLARRQGLPESDEHFRQALAQWDQAWQERLQSAAGLLENKALALLCLGRKDEALTTLKLVPLSYCTSWSRCDITENQAG